MLWFTGGGGGGGEESTCPSVESLVNWLLEHDDATLSEVSDDDSDVSPAYIDDLWSDTESVLMDDLPDIPDEVFFSTSSASHFGTVGLGSKTGTRFTKYFTIILR